MAPPGLIILMHLVPLLSDPHTMMRSRVCCDMNGIPCDPSVNLFAGVLLRLSATMTSPSAVRMAIFPDSQSPAVATIPVISELIHVGAAPLACLPVSHLQRNKNFSGETKGCKRGRQLT